MQELGFIFTRHIRNTEHKDMWKTCLRCIRKHYIDEPVIIIDDASDVSLIDALDTDDQILMQNVTVIESEYPKAGELLSYYYFYKLRPFKKAVIIHDAMFLQKPLNMIDEIDDYRFLWYFDNFCRWDKDCHPHVVRFLHSNILQNTALLKQLYVSDDWNGCFGVSSVICLDFMTTLQDKYNILGLLPYIKNRDIRSAIERIFALVCICEKHYDKYCLSLFGNIHHYKYTFGYSYDNYIKDSLSVREDELYIIKCWSGR